MVDMNGTLRQELAGGGMLRVNEMSSPLPTTSQVSQNKRLEGTLKEYRGKYMQIESLKMYF